MKIILNLGIKPDFYLKYNRIKGLVGEWKSGTASLNTDSQWSKHEACFARSTQMWLITTPVSHLANEFDVRSELRVRSSLAAVNQMRL